MQVGYVGLLKAINNFDPAFGGALAYALYHQRQINWHFPR